MARTTRKPKPKAAEVLRGRFCSTAFRVKGERAFGADPATVEMPDHLEIFNCQRDGNTLHCIAGKRTAPRTRLEVRAPSVHGLLADAGGGTAVEGPAGWIETLQRHLHEDFGIFIFETAGAENFHTCIAPDRFGTTRGRRLDRGGST